MTLPSLELLLAGAILVSLTIYALTGGADFGGGVWELFAWGPRAQQQKGLIIKAIGPIWEANHVWLILVIVLLFTCFPPAFSAIATVLHIPLNLMLFGIVLRGSAFAFRSHYHGKDIAQPPWGPVFAVASVITPFMLGVILGAIASGNLDGKENSFAAVFVYSWLAPFPVAVGLFALVLFAYLAAVYLTLETDSPRLRTDFRNRALGAAVGVGLMALAVFLLSGSGAPSIERDLTTSWWTLPLLLATAVMAAGAIFTLSTGRFHLARLCAMGQVTLILWGWALAQFPYLVEPTLTIYNAAAPLVTLRVVLFALVAGAVVLLPSYYFLFRVFKDSSLIGTKHPHQD